MASLTLTVGTVTSSATTTNTKAQEIFDLFISAYNLPDTVSNQEKLDFIKSELISYITSIARGEKRRQLVKAAQDTATSGESSIGW